MKTRRIEERRRVAARRGTARHNWPPRCKYTCTSYAPTRVFFCVGWFVEVPAADRDQGESGSGLGSKMLHERVHVRRCNWSFVRSFARSFVRSFVRSLARSLVLSNGPCERYPVHMCACSSRSTHPSQKSLDSHLFLPCRRFICNLKRASIAQCPVSPSQRPHISP